MLDLPLILASLREMHNQAEEKKKKKTKKTVKTKQLSDVFSDTR